MAVASILERASAGEISPKLWLDRSHVSMLPDDSGLGGRGIEGRGMKGS